MPRWDEPTDASGRTVSNLPNLVALIHLPTLATAFGLAPLSAPQWLLLAAFALLVLLLEEVRKAVARRVGAWG